MDFLLGTVVIALELVPTSKRLFGSDIPQGNRDLVSSSNHIPNQVKVDQEELAFDVQDRMVLLRFLCSDWASRYVQVKVIGHWGQGHILYHKARAQGPIGLGPAPCSTTRLGSYEQWA